MALASGPVVVVERRAGGAALSILADRSNATDEGESRGLAGVPDTPTMVGLKKKNVSEEPQAERWRTYVGEEVDGPEASVADESVAARAGLGLALSIPAGRRQRAYDRAGLAVLAAEESLSARKRRTEATLAHQLKLSDETSWQDLVEAFQSERPLHLAEQTPPLQVAPSELRTEVEHLLFSFPQLRGCEGSSTSGKLGRRTKNARR